MTALLVMKRVIYQFSLVCTIHMTRNHWVTWRSTVAVETVVYAYKNICIMITFEFFPRYHIHVCVHCARFIFYSKFSKCKPILIILSLSHFSDEL